MKIYTKTGDDGSTGLFAGPRALKCDPRIEAFGTIDELNAALGVVVQELEDIALRDVVIAFQNELFALGAELATPDPTAQGSQFATADRVAAIELLIDRFETELPPLTNFILPGGVRAAVGLHLARTICRRGERVVVELALQPAAKVSPLVVQYLNRLSDLLFVMCRLCNHRAGVSDTIWQSGRTRH